MLFPHRLVVVLFLSLFVVAFSGFAQGQVINEFVVNHTGTDTHEFIEVLGTPNDDLSDLTLVQIEGDDDDNPGYIVRAIEVGTTDGDGLWWTDFLAEPGMNDDDYVTFFLVTGFSGVAGTDLDLFDDGSLDSTPWTAIVDEVGVVGWDNVNNLPVSGFNYTSINLEPNSDGQPYSWGGASRIPNGTDTDTPADWVRNDYSGAGLPGFSGTVDANEAFNTPGNLNSTTEPPPVQDPLINEWVADHVGSDDHEYIEIIADPSTDYSDVCLLVVVGDSPSTGVVDVALQIGTTDSEGYWTTGFMNSALEDGSYTIILADYPSCGMIVGTDLDTNDSGSFNLTPWSGIHDSVSVSDGGAGDLSYSSVVLGTGFDGVAGVPGGASRIPNGIDNDMVDDWWRNNFEGDGLDGFSGTAGDTEAINTPGEENQAGGDSYYAGVDSSNSADLRASLHQLIDDHQRFPYSSSSTDTWDVLEAADEDPADSGRILDVYKNASYAKAGGGNSNYNREHSWPNSYGFPDDSDIPYTDCHHLFLSNDDYNSDRGSNPFGNCVSGCTEDPTEFNNGTGGPGMSNWYNADVWETWPGRKGDVARAQFYMDVRYEGGTHAPTGTPEPDLILTDNDSLIHSTSGSPAYMGYLSVLLQWHLDDPVDLDELNRNDVVFSYQGNRNPFVDHPEWVECVFLGTGCGGTLFEDGFETGDTSGWSTTAP